MTLELNQVAPQVRAMGQLLKEHKTGRDEALVLAQQLLGAFSTEFTALDDRVQQAELVQQRLRFDWVGAAPTHEALAKSHPLPTASERVTVIASDGSQIFPDQHAVTMYYVINIGTIVYRHGSNQKPVTHNPKPILCYEPEEIFDAFGRLISAGEVTVRRDMAELDILRKMAPAYTFQSDEPVITMIDGQLTLRVIDLPFAQQGERQDEYVEMLNSLRESNALLAGYIDRPRSTFVLSLMQLASFDIADITEENLRHNPFRHLTDIELFQFLGPGERSAIFAVRAKGLEKYTQAGHAIHFFYLNVGITEAIPILARVEIPAWIATNPQRVDVLHAILVRQARIMGGYPYVLARADELAVITGEEREAVELMLSLEMRRQGLTPALSLKQQNKNAFRAGKESFQL